MADRCSVGIDVPTNKIVMSTSSTAVASIMAIALQSSRQVYSLKSITI